MASQFPSLEQLTRKRIAQESERMDKDIEMQENWANHLSPSIVEASSNEHLDPLDENRKQTNCPVWRMIQTVLVFYKVIDREENKFVLKEIVMNCL